MSARKTTMALVAVLGLLVAGAAQAAPVPDLTGTYKGTQVCADLFDGEREGFVVTDDIIEISQTGDRIRFASARFRYEGVVQGINKSKSGEALVITCDGQLADEIVRIENVRVGPGSAGGWEAISVYFSEDGGTCFSDCKWTYERISDDDPGVPACGD